MVLVIYSDTSKNNASILSALILSPFKLKCKPSTADGLGQVLPKKEIASKAKFNSFGITY